MQPDTGGELPTAGRYRLYTALIEAVNRYAEANHFHPILPSSSAPCQEFAETEPFPLGVTWGVLPQSHSFHKQMAAAHLKKVYCIGSAYRRTEEDALHSEIFHQIEFEMADATADAARSLAIALLTAVMHSVEEQLGVTPLWTLERVDEMDLRDMRNPPDYYQYDTWVRDRVETLTRPTWVLHTPKTPPPRLNRTDGPHSHGFDLLTPPPSGEVLSGGEREPGTASQFLRVPPDEDISNETTFSGFGIGLERLVMALTRTEPISDARYPYSGPWR